MKKLTFYMDESLHTIADIDKRRFGFFGIIGGLDEELQRINAELAEIRDLTIYGRRLNTIGQGQELKWSLRQPFRHANVREDRVIEAIKLSVELFIKEAQLGNIAFTMCGHYQTDFPEGYLETLDEDSLSYYMMHAALEAFRSHPARNMAYSAGKKQIDFIFDESRIEFDKRVAAPFCESFLKGNSRYRDDIRFRIYSAKSHQVPLLQMTDLLVGYFAYMETRTNLTARQFLEGYAMLWYNPDFLDFMERCHIPSLRGKQLVCMTEPLLDMATPYIHKPDAIYHQFEVAKWVKDVPACPIIAPDGTYVFDPDERITHMKQSVERYDQYIIKGQKEILEGAHGLKFPVPKKNIFE